MKVVPTEHPEVLLVEPDIFRDERGFFMESFHAGKYPQHGLPGSFLQDNHSRSSRGVLRGLHYQLEHPQGKLVRVVTGEVLDVAVDIRKGSPRFGEAVQVRYYDLFDDDDPTLPPEAKLPLVLVEGEVLSSGGKISVPAIRKRLETLGLPKN